MASGSPGVAECRSARPLTRSVEQRTGHDARNISASADKHQESRARLESWTGEPCVARTVHVRFDTGSLCPARRNRVRWEVVEQQNADAGPWLDARLMSRRYADRYLHAKPSPAGGSMADGRQECLEWRLITT